MSKKWVVIVLGVLWAAIVIFLVARFVISIIAQSKTQAEWKQEQLQTNLYHETGLVFMDHDVQDLVWDGRYIWAVSKIPPENNVTPRKNGVIERIDPFVGRITAEVKLFSQSPMALVWDGQDVWVASQNEPLVQRMDPQRLMVTQVISVPVGICAMIWDGSSLWAANLNTISVQKLDTRQGIVAQEITLQNDPVGMAWQPGSLWVAERVMDERTSEETGLVEQIDLAAGKAVKEIHMDYVPRAIAAAQDSLWVADLRSLGKYDPSSGEMLAKVPIDGYLERLYYDGASIWVPNLRTKTLLQIDPSRAQVIATLPVKYTANALAFDGDHIWAGVCGSEWYCVVQKITPSEAPIDDVPAAIVWDGSQVWIVVGKYSGFGGVQRFDPVTGKISYEIRLSGTPSAAAWDGRSLWVADWDHSLLQRIDPEKMAVVGEVHVGEKPSGLAWDGASLWVANSWGSSVSRIDPQTEQVVADIPMGSHLGDILWEGGYFWVLAEKSVYKIDPKTQEVVTFPIDGEPASIAWGGDSLWVRLLYSGKVLRVDPQTGGVLSKMRPCELSLQWDLEKCRALPEDAVMLNICTLQPAAWDGKDLWAVCEDTAVVQIDPQTQHILTAIGIQDPQAFAWDGNYLWVANRDILERIDVRSTNYIQEAWQLPSGIK